MNGNKRGYEADPDYENFADVERKRQKRSEQDCRDITLTKIRSIVTEQFSTELEKKKAEVLTADDRIRTLKATLDKLRSCVVTNYYGKITTPQGPNEAPSIHPAVKKFLGKAPKALLSDNEVEPDSQFGRNTPHEVLKATQSCENVSQIRANGVSSAARREAIPVNTAPGPGPVRGPNRGSRLTERKTVIVGNVSRYIPTDQRDSNDPSTHKWMVYVRGPRDAPGIDSFVSKVWFFLHPSYRPNDLVEVKSAPFHLTRRGWGEFPIRIQLFFKDARNKRVDVIHNLKFDRTYTGLQTMGGETVAEVEIMRLAEAIETPPAPSAASTHTANTTNGTENNIVIKEYTSPTKEHENAPANKTNATTTSTSTQKHHSPTLPNGDASPPCSKYTAVKPRYDDVIVSVAPPTTSVTFQTPLRPSSLPSSALSTGPGAAAGVQSPGSDHSSTGGGASGGARNGDVTSRSLPVTVATTDAAVAGPGDGQYVKCRDAQGKVYLVPRSTLLAMGKLPVRSRATTTQTHRLPLVHSTASAAGAQASTSSLLATSAIKALVTSSGPPTSTPNTMLLLTSAQIAGTQVIGVRPPSVAMTTISGKKPLAAGGATTLAPTYLYSSALKNTSSITSLKRESSLAVTKQATDSNSIKKGPLVLQSGSLLSRKMASADNVPPGSSLLLRRQSDDVTEPRPVAAPSRPQSFYIRTKVQGKEILLSLGSAATPVENPRPQRPSYEEDDDDVTPDEDQESVTSTEEPAEVDVWLQHGRLGDTINVNDHSDTQSLVCSILKRCPLIGGEKPWLPKTIQQYLSWPIPKRRASEWLRARQVVKLLTSTLRREKSSMEPWTTKQVLRWCRQRLYTPIDTELKSPQVDAAPVSSASCFTYCDASAVWNNAMHISEKDAHATAQVVPWCPGSDEEVDVEGTDTPPPVKQELPPRNINPYFDHDYSAPRSLRSSELGSWVHNNLQETLDLRLDSQPVTENVSAPVVGEMLGTCMRQFATRWLRESVALVAKDERQPDTLSLNDVTTGLAMLPEADVITNMGLGAQLSASNSTTWS